MINLSDVISVWEEIHGKDCGELGYCDLEKAIEKVVGLHDDVSGQNRDFLSMERENQTSESFNVLSQEIKNDPEFAWAWHCNIAMAAYDEGLEHMAANRAAARFMYTCFRVDTTKHEHFLSMKAQQSVAPDERR